MKVLVAREALIEWITSASITLNTDIEFVYPEHGLDEEMQELAKDVDVIVATRLHSSIIQAAKNLKLIQKTGAGVDAIPFDVIPDHVFVANTSGANPVPMAEGTIALMFALAKQIVSKHTNFPNRSPMRGVELRDKHVVIVGMGSIGLEVAKRLTAFGMNIHGVQRTPKPQLVEEYGLASVVGRDDLDNLLEIADFILLTAPLTPFTRGIIGEKELALMKQTAYLVNIGRAGLIDEEPMYYALKENRIAGAAFDVWWIPHWWDHKWGPKLGVPSRFPIWELDNVIAIPHNVGFVERTEYSSRSSEIIASNLNRISEGKDPVNLVDKTFQY